MAKYPISIHSGKVSKAFLDILTFHVPPTGTKIILDPTCGKRHLWREFYKTNMEGKTILESFGQVIFSDIKDYGQKYVTDIFKLKPNILFDAEVYDPPYFFGVQSTTDEREEDYGGYIQTYKDLLKYMDVANEKMPNWVKDDGKLILKCSDQYNVQERKFYALHNTWINRLTIDELTRSGEASWNIIDSYIYQHHNMSPTAFQVKDRPCGVIMHTYFLVFNKKEY